MLHALGHFRSDTSEYPGEDPDLNLYTSEAVAAVDSFREAQGWRTTVPGYVDAATVERLWSRLEAAGMADALRERLLEIQSIRR